MNTASLRALRTGLIALAAVLTLGTAVADKPEWAGGGRGHDKHDRGNPSERGARHDRDDRRDRDDKKHNKKRDHDDDRRWQGHQGDQRHGDRDDDRDRRHAREHRERDRDHYHRAPVVMINPGGYFNDHHRRYARDWYGEQVRMGHCPPGLAKKHNGCMPPGQARKWAVGRPLPASVVYYPVPQPILVQLGAPPAGYHYGRVANDIVLMPVGSRLVVDAIIDLGRFR